MHPELREAMARGRGRELERALRVARLLADAAPAEPSALSLVWERGEGRRRPRLRAAWTRAS
jgi:hypothetical protein